jgi:RNA polymerase sigma-70 factor (ECF subfamily)
VDDATLLLLQQWRAGDQEAAGELFRRYANRLIALARSRLSPRLAQRIDPEDVVQSAYRSFFTGAKNGQYDLERGGDLWRLLVAITLHKLHDQAKRHRAGKRSVQNETPLGNGANGTPAEAREPSPVEALALVDQLEQMMRRLEPPQRQMLELRLQGYTFEEIAATVRLSRRTVCRTLERVKQWLEEWPEDPAS